MVMTRHRGKSTRSIALVAAASAILKEIQPASVRAVCYQLFTRGFIDSMAKSETNRVSSQLTWAREAGVIPWAWIVDETRASETVSAWKNPEAYIETVRRSYRRDRWTDQPCRIEIWSEKGTIRGTVAPVLQEYGVTFRVMHGYTSATTAYQVAAESRQGKFLTVFYLGDWDPSGMHMSEIDIPSRVEAYGGDLGLERLALNEADIAAGLPYFLTESKRKDPRYAWYQRRYGSRCWELDALSPVVLRERVEQAIRARLDLEAWQRADLVERAERESLSTILNAWPGISGQASKYSAGETP